MIKGIDVSYWNQSMDWGKALAAGTQFAMIRATHGTKTVDTYLNENILGCNKYGIPYGVYHYFKPELNAKMQVDFFLHLGV